MLHTIIHLAATSEVMETAFELTCAKTLQDVDELGSRDIDLLLRQSALFVLVVGRWWGDRGRIVGRSWGDCGEIVGR